MSLLLMVHYYALSLTLIYIEIKLLYLNAVNAVLIHSILLYFLRLVPAIAIYTPEGPRTGSKYSLLLTLVMTFRYMAHE